VTWARLDPPGDPLPGSVISLSSGGARIEAPTSPAVGQLVSIELQSAEPPLDLVAFGRVIWVRSDSRPGRSIWAVAFEGLDLEVQAVLARFVFCEAARRGKGSRRIVGAA